MGGWREEANPTAGTGTGRLPVRLEKDGDKLSWVSFGDADGEAARTEGWLSGVWASEDTEQAPVCSSTRRDINESEEVMESRADTVPVCE